jgi:hypothetical protein
MGMEDLQPCYIDMAYEAGFGEKNINNIQIIGESIKSVRKKFQRNCGLDRSLCEGKLVLSSQKACSTCRFLAEQLSQDSGVKSLKLNNKLKLFFGGVEDTNPSEVVVGVGNCCIKNKEKCNAFIPGCPPKKRDIVKAIIDEYRFEDH